MERRMRGAGIHEFAWAIWPWMNWLLPPILMLIIGNGGWLLLFLIVFAPILVPVAGLLGSLPRFLLRRAGHSATPGPIAALLFVQWWACTTAAMTFNGATDSTPIPAVLQGFSARPLAGDFLRATMVAGAVIGAVCGVGILVVAIIVARSTRGSSGPVGATGPVSTRFAWMACFALPVLFLLTIWVGGVVTSQQRDASGTTVAEVEAASLSERAAMMVLRYDAAQEQLAIVRGMIADEGWELSSRAIGSHMSTMHGRAVYWMDLSFLHEPVPTGVDVDALEAELLDNGWTRGGYGEIVDPYGNVVEVSAGENTVRVSLESPEWWGDSYELAEELGLYDDLGREGLPDEYAWDEWPPP